MPPRPREEIAESFWKQAGGRDRFGEPADIGLAAAFVLPVAVRLIPHLDTQLVTQILAGIGASPWLDKSPRLLRGCLVADGGKAMVLVDQHDPEDERRMTVAHEVAHLLLHYLQPREDAVTAFGPGIIAVLDRTRSPTIGERLSSALRNVPIEPYQHAMDRSPVHGRAVGAMEDEADDLAIELLAPWRELKKMRGAAPSALRQRFGLPASVATRLAALISPAGTMPGVLSLFGKK
ncbi:ImmA/IrrE family metallo-endopeptidase [Bosea sp. NPDC055353]